MKTIIITGGSSGIGRETVLKLALQGHRVIAIGRDKDRLKTLADKSNHIETLSADIATEEGRQRVKNHIGNDKVNVLINNAGIMTPAGPLAKIDTESWRYQLSVNVEAPLFLSQLLLNNLTGGRILNLTIYSSFSVTPGLASYGISKAALNMLVEYMRSEWREQHISVGLILPGIVDTQIQKQLPKDSKAHDIQRLQPALVADFLCWLALDADRAKLENDVIDIYADWHQQHWNAGALISKPF